MGTIVNAPAVANAAKLAMPMQPVSHGDGMASMKDFIKELTGLVREFNSLKSSLGVQSSPTHGSAGVPMNAAHIPTSNNAQVVYRMNINEGQIKAFLYDILVNQAELLPQDIKDKKIGDLLGANLKTFQYDYNGIVLGSEHLLNVMTKNLYTQLQRMNANAQTTPTIVEVPTNEQKTDVDAEQKRQPEKPQA